MRRPHEGNRPAAPPPIPPRGYFKDPCIHHFRHIDTCKFKVTTEGMLYKWKVVDRFFCERCLTTKTKESFYEVGEYR